MTWKTIAVLLGGTALASAQSIDLGDLKLNTDSLTAQLGDLRLQMRALDKEMPRLQALQLSPLSELGLLPMLMFDEHGDGSDDHDYSAGTTALDANHFEDAIHDFESVISHNGAHADGAYYWKAYAQNRLSRRSAALATLAALRQKFPESRWRDDAKALEVEIQTQSGGTVSPGGESNEELKLIAVNALMQSDPNQAVPILTKLLKSNQSPGLKDRALFVLAQSESPEARKTLLELARGNADPDLQFRAVRYIAMMGGARAQSELAGIYGSVSDNRLKHEILRSYLISGSKAPLLQVALNEKDPGLRREAIRTLAQSGGKDELWTIYQHEGSPEMRKEIVQSMLMDGDSAHLLEIARTDKDAEIRRDAVRTLALTGWGKDNGAMVGLYDKESDPATKRELIQGMFLQQNAKGLVELARREKNPELKKDIVQQLSLMHSKEATDYMMELLK